MCDRLMDDTGSVVRSRSLIFAGPHACQGRALLKSECRSLVCFFTFNLLVSSIANPVLTHSEKLLKITRDLSEPINFESLTPENELRSVSSLLNFVVFG